MTKKNLVYPYEGYSSSGSDADYEQPTKKYYVDFTSLVIDHRTYEKLKSDRFGYLNGKEFLKELVDQDVIEIVNIDEADELDDLTYPKTISNAVNKYLGGK